MNRELPPMSRAAHDVLNAYPKPTLGPMRRSAMRSELDAAMSAGPAGNVPTPSGLGARAGLASKPWLWIVLGAVVVVGGGLGLTTPHAQPPIREVVARATPTPPIEPRAATAPPPAVAPAAPAPELETDPVAPAPPTAPGVANDPMAASTPTASATAPTAKRKAKPAAVSTAAEEARLLRRAQTSLRDGRAADALAVVAEHERRFPSGKLTEAREAVRAVAECERQPDRRARHRDAFLSQYPGSAFSSRVRNACAATP